MQCALLTSTVPLPVHASMLKQLGLDKIVFDWQAFEEKTDSTLMGRKGLYTYLMDSLIRAKGRGLNIDVHFIPMKPNYKQLPDIVCHSKSKAAQQGPLSSLWTMDRGKAPLGPAAGAAGDRGGSGAKARRLPGVSAAHGGVRLSNKAWAGRRDLVPGPWAGKVHPPAGFYPCLLYTSW